MDAINRSGRFHRGLALTKSSLRLLSLDKELVALPVLSIICCTLALVAVTAGFIGVLTAIYGQTFSTTSSLPIVIIGVVLYAFCVVIGNFFNGAVIYGATQRFKGGTPTVRNSLSGAWRKFRPLALFSLLMASAGLVLQLLERRLPWLAKIGINLLGAAWSIANVFAVPVIVLSDKDIKPLEATHESVKIIRNTWGESVFADLGIAIIGLLSFAGYIGFWILFGVFDASIGGVPRAVSSVLFVLGALGLISLFALLAALSSITKAALYHYATTGRAPELFNRELLQASMTVKKARKVFG